MPTLIDSYSESNYSGSYGLSPFASYHGVGQSFANTNQGVLQSVKFYLLKNNTPTGNVVVKIYAHTGTFGSGGSGTGDVLATSDSIDVSTISDSAFTLYTFTFSGTNKITLDSSTNYVALVYYIGTGSNYLKVGVDLSTPSHAGNASGIISGTWYTTGENIEDYDIIFYVYADASSTSASPSTSPSPSTSISVSPSASISQSPSISPSASTSISPSSSISTSTSISISPSVSVSTSTSISPSISPSVSPSAGYEDYTKGDYISIPTGITDLTNSYTTQEYTDVLSVNGVFVSQTTSSDYTIHQFKEYCGSSNMCNLTCVCQTNYLPSLSPVYLQIYNRNSSLWETVDTNNTANVDTNFTLSADVLNLTNYKDNNTVIVCRVYQQG